jgi:hypothetical protein
MDFNGKLLIISLVGFVVLFSLSYWMLHEYCSFFSDNIPSGSAGDAMTFQVTPCAICRDLRMASFASIVRGISFGFLILPLIVNGLNKLHNRTSDKVKFLD